MGTEPHVLHCCLQCQLATAPWLLTGAILSLDQWASVGVWVRAVGGMLGGGLQAGKSRWDFSGDSPIYPPQHTHSAAL